MKSSATKASPPALKGINPEGYANLVKLFQNYKLENGQTVWENVQGRYKGNNESTLFNEAIARLSENENRSAREETLWKRIVESVRLWLAKKGFKDWKDADVTALIRRSAEGLRNRKASATNAERLFSRKADPNQTGFDFDAPAAPQSQQTPAPEKAGSAFDKSLREQRRSEDDDIRKRPAYQQPFKIWAELEIARKLGAGYSELSFEEMQLFRDQWNEMRIQAIARKELIYADANTVENPPKRWTKKDDLFYPPVAKTPTIEQNGEGNLFPEAAMPFNLSGETMDPAAQPTGDQLELSAEEAITEAASPSGLQVFGEKIAGAGKDRQASLDKNLKKATDSDLSVAYGEGNAPLANTDAIRDTLRFRPLGESEVDGDIRERLEFINRKLPNDALDARVLEGRRRGDLLLEASVEESGSSFAGFNRGVEELFRKRVVFVAGVSPDYASGFTFPDAYDDTIFLNVEGKHPAAFLLGHEFGHTLQVGNSALYSDLSDLLGSTRKMFKLCSPGISISTMVA